ncbi:MAG: DNA-directed RNA polymerase, subunit M/Transcription elongation factor TFIIS [Promethearchaeota archaeon]|nr:MAG: DNA-directed RNA polymerase, subunit M/Transcription elongation factor TFIIS [Candidatus Lokiarchaeota archaeon]
MRFCENCNNILIPRKGKLYCKACDEEFEIGANQDDYKIIKKIIHDDKETAPVIVKESVREGRISPQDRKAFEEYFGKSESQGF